jgi:hypothetical protein
MKLKNTSLTWNRYPAWVGNREGRFFYHSPLNQGTAYWISQSAETSLWSVEDNHGAVWGQFKTAKQAIRAVELN